MLALFPKAKEEVGSTQDHLKFAEIHDGIVITKKGELRAILMVSPINFALKSEQEQTAIIYAYQNFLNSLNFPIQVLMRSKKLDLTKYLNKLKEAAKTQTNELLMIQTKDYIDFIERLIKIANIMDKKFYIVVPFIPPPRFETPKMSKISETIRKPTQSSASQIQMTFEEFKKYKIELDQRTQVIQSGLGSVGIRTAQLNTQQVIELYYEIYNPEEANKEQLIDAEALTGELIESELEKEPSNEPK